VPPRAGGGASPRAGGGASPRAEGGSRVGALDGVGAEPAARVFSAVPSCVVDGRREELRETDCERLRSVYDDMSV